MIGCLALAGCGSGAPEKPKDASKADAKKEETPISTAVTKGGSATRYSDGADRHALWNVKWGNGEIKYSEQGEFGGTMESVEGDIYRNGKVVSHFSAATAKSDFGKKSLHLGGKVVVRNEEPAIHLRCDAVVWNPDADRLEATGKVIVKSGDVEMGPFDSIYASPDLKEISTPDLFRKSK